MNRRLKIHASIAKLRDGYSVTVSITENEETRELITRTVRSRFGAETIAKAFASHYDVPWHRVQVALGKLSWAKGPPKPVSPLSRG
jgi:hypothetical protein